MAKKITNLDKRTDKETAKKRIVEFLDKNGYTASRLNFARPSQIGYAAYPDYDLTPQGAAFSVQKILKEMVDSKEIEWHSEGKNQSGYWLLKFD